MQGCCICQNSDIPIVTNSEIRFNDFIRVYNHDYPDEKIVWSNETACAVDFVGGKTGRAVTIFTERVLPFAHVGFGQDEDVSIKCKMENCNT